MKQQYTQRNPLQGLLCNALYYAQPASLTATVNDHSITQGIRTLAQNELNRRQRRAIRRTFK